VLAAPRLRAPGPSTPDAALKRAARGGGSTGRSRRTACCERSRTTLRTNLGARAAQHASRLCARSRPAACRERSRTTLRTNLGARAAQHASRRSAREGHSVACPEIRRGQPTLAGSDHDRRMRPGLRKPTERARAFPQQRAIGPAVTSRACANVTPKPRAESAARPYLTRPVAPTRTALQALRRSPRSKPANPNQHKSRGARHPTSARESHTRLASRWRS
jgi:hypothetical protein